MLHGDGEPILFYYENDSVRGINVVMKRDVSFDSNFVETKKINPENIDMGYFNEFRRRTASGN